MTVSICVIGALRATYDAEAAFDGESRPAGIGVLLSVALARLGAEVRFLAGARENVATPSARAPLVAEGIDVHPFLLGEPASADPESTESAPDPLPELATVLRDLPDVDLLVLQLELPDPPLEQVLAAAREESRRVVLHALPARPLESDCLANVELLIATNDDAITLTRQEGEKVSRKGLARRLSALGPARITLTSIEGRALSFDGETFHEAKSEPGEDAPTGLTAQFLFSAALSVAYARGHNAERALRVATAAVGLPIAGSGDFPGLPSARDLEAIEESS